MTDEIIRNEDTLETEAGGAGKHDTMPPGAVAADGDDGRGGGYGKPPKHSQFKPGQSGNPRGRAKGARGLTTYLKAELNERVTITENGKTKRVNKLQVVIKALAAKAAKGDVNAADKLLSLVIQSQGFEDERKTAKRLSANDQEILDRFFAPPLEQAAPPVADTAFALPASDGVAPSDDPDDLAAPNP